MQNSIGEHIAKSIFTTFTEREGAELLVDREVPLEIRREAVRAFLRRSKETLDNAPDSGEMKKFLVALWNAKLMMNMIEEEIGLGFAWDPPFVEEVRGVLGDMEALCDEMNIQMQAKKLMLIMTPKD